MAFPARVDPKGQESKAATAKGPNDDAKRIQLAITSYNYAPAVTPQRTAKYIKPFGSAIVYEGFRYIPEGTRRISTKTRKTDAR